MQSAQPIHFSASIVSDPALSSLMAPVGQASMQSGCSQCRQTTGNITFLASSLSIWILDLRGLNVVVCLIEQASSHDLHPVQRLILTTRILFNSSGRSMVGDEASDHKASGHLSCCHCVSVFCHEKVLKAHVFGFTAGLRVAFQFASNEVLRWLPNEKPKP